MVLVEIVSWLSQEAVPEPSCGLDPSKIGSRLVVGFGESDSHIGLCVEETSASILSAPRIPLLFFTKIGCPDKFGIGTGMRSSTVVLSGMGMKVLSLRYRRWLRL